MLDRLRIDADGGLLGTWQAEVDRDPSYRLALFRNDLEQLLDRVQVRLELRPGQWLRGDSGSPDLAGEPLAGEPLTLREVLALDPERHPWVTRRWMLRGEPGAGKTTLLRHLAATLAKEKDPRWVPIFESVAHLVREPELLHVRLDRELQLEGAKGKGRAAALEREAQEGRLLLLFDGLDEVPEGDREKAEALLRGLCDRWPKTPLVVTSRPNGFRRPGDDFVELDLLPFDDDQRWEFLDGWLEGSDWAEEARANVLLSVLRTSSALWELAGNPLYLTLIALLFEERPRLLRMMFPVDIPDTLVTSLIKADRALGLRAMASAQRLSSKTLRTALSLTHDWRERAEVYVQIHRLIDDPEGALALLEELHQCCYGGSDLFLLERAVTLVALRWPEVGLAADELSARFYDSIPPPPAELFEWVETPLDGWVELWREIPAGSIRLGSPERGSERSQHEVRIASPFLMTTVPVTNAQYGAFDSHHPADEKLSHHPATGVTWYAALAFCRWLERHLPGVRLAMEAEWEHACRAGTTTHFWSGDGEADLGRVGWYGANSGRRTHRVGEKPANAWGLYDLHGNVWEWTQSPWAEDPSKPAAVTIDPQQAPAPTLKDFANESVATPGGNRVARGGSCWNAATAARSAFRFMSPPASRRGDLGFRLVRPL